MVGPAWVGAPLGGKLATCGPRVGLVLWEPGSGGVVVSPFMAGPKMGGSHGGSPEEKSWAGCAKARSHWVVVPASDKGCMHTLTESAGAGVSQ